MYTVVIVDDEHMIKLTLRKLIDSSDIPFQVVGEAEDGQEALSAIEQWNPNLVITDIRMPVMGGLELIEEARRRNLRSEFIIISGHDDFTYAQMAMRFGVVDYLLKPISPLQLQETLERVLNRFKVEKQSKLERSEWIRYCKNRALPLVKHLELLNESEVLEELKDIHSDLLGKIVDYGMLKQVYLDLMSLIDGEMDQRIGHTRRQEPVDLSTVLERPEFIYHAVETHILKMIEEIRLTRNWGSHQNIKRASEYMQERFAKESLSLQEVADVIGMSASYFSRSFKEEFGISFIQYLTKLRLEKAKSLLSDPNCKTYEIAYSVGYTDYPHFTKVFKKYWGLSPTEVKKRM